MENIIRKIKHGKIRQKIKKIEIKNKKGNRKKSGKSNIKMKTRYKNLSPYSISIGKGDKNNNQTKVKIIVVKIISIKII